jgi:imidazoleglycerol-phosphate dehydratase
MRKAEIARKTNETDIRVSVNLDGTGKHAINTGVGFLDHMLDQLAKHAPSPSASTRPTGSR